MDVVEAAIHDGTVAADVDPRDIVNIVLLGVRDEAYLTMRELALEVLRNPERIGTTSTSEGLACALMFARADWLGKLFVGGSRAARRPRVAQGDPWTLRTISAGCARRSISARPARHWRAPNAATTAGGSHEDDRAHRAAEH